MTYTEHLSFENDMFIMSKEADLGREELLGFIERHRLRLPRYESLRNQYITKPPILKKGKKEGGKPDHRIPVNFGRYIVDTFNGFFSGVPIRITHEDEAIQWFVDEFWNNNDMDNVLNETAKLTSIYGHAYWYLYQNEETETEVAYRDPTDMFVIYTNEIRPRSLYGVRYWEELNGEGLTEYVGQIFTDEYEQGFRLNEEELILSEEVEDLFYGRVPIIEVIENEEREGLISPVEIMINHYNEALSNKSNDLSYYAEQYLLILGLDVEEEDLNNMTERRTIIAPDEESKNAIVKFLEKPDADVSQENFLDRVERKIYETSKVVNLNDDSLGNSNSSSGEALKRKEQPMNHMAMNKERKYNQALRTLFGMVFNLRTNVPPQDREEYKAINFKWTRNLPSNKVNEAEIVKKLDGIISRRRQLEMLSDIEDVEVELRRLQEEEGRLVEDIKEVEEGSDVTQE